MLNQKMIKHDKKLERPGILGTTFTARLTIWDHCGGERCSLFRDIVAMIPRF
jgi:hypothetical protein